MTREREQELVLLAAAGDRAAAGELVRAHQERLVAFLLRMTGRRDTAEDVAQEAFVRALRSLPRFDPQYRFSTWLFTIARRVYWNMAEKMAPRSNSELLTRVADGVAGGTIAPAWGLTNWANEHAEENALQRGVLQRALMDLPDNQREIVILFHQQNWPVGMIAEALGIPAGTVKSHLHRGRNRLRESLYQHGWRFDADAGLRNVGGGQNNGGGPSGSVPGTSGPSAGGPGTDGLKDAPIVEVPHARRGAEERGV
ncbi:MAG TPA: sigma-70 family RNA polymerase sigma factor [Phycisphaerales bacterium]|nr:sigma-70 family RNA polymerase sigma factor [Phycisphaerales bacterium]